MMHLGRIIHYYITNMGKNASLAMITLMAYVVPVSVCRQIS